MESITDQAVLETAEPLQLDAEDRGRVLRGMFALLASQVITTPISMLVTAVLGHHLSPADFGALYVVQTAAGVGFLVADWGQTAAVAAEVARHPTRAGRLLGTSLVTKVVLSALAVAGMLIAGHFLHYTNIEFAGILFLSVAGFAGALQASGTAVLQGYERVTWVSAIGVAGNLCSAALVITMALLEFGLRGVLWACAISSLVPFAITIFLLRRAGVPRPRADRATLHSILGKSSAFLVFNLVLALQPYIDNAFLMQLVPQEVLGWQAATRRIAGMLVFPAVTLAFSLYPTLARLHAESPTREIEMMRTALSRMVLAGVPAALGAVLYARPVVAVLYGNGRYVGAAINLQWLAPWVFFVYFSILIGTSLMARGRVLAWSGVQAICLVVSVAANGPLVRFFQAQFANGAIGVSVSNVISEVLMAGIGVSMLPRETLRGGFTRALSQALIAGAAMVVVGLLLAGLPALISGALAVGAYTAVLLALGALKPSELRLLLAGLRSKIEQRLNRAH
jgi:O-antigen/teichoic acid export membrane protein